MPPDVHPVIAAELRKEGQRYTPIRRRIVEILADSPRPLTIPEILEDGRGLAQSSIYRNLAVLERAGVVHRVVTSEEHARYELAEGLAGHHHHLVCLACGRVEDFVTPPRVERLLNRAVEEVAASGTGFSPTHHRLDLVGLCARCG